MSKVTITPPEGYEVDQENSTFSCIKFKEIIKYKKGWYVDTSSDVCQTQSLDASHKCNRNVWATEAQARACLAMAELSQLMQEANGGWEPEWDDKDELRVIIRLNKGDWEPLNAHYLRRFLVFKSMKVAEDFIRDNKEKMEEAQALLYQQGNWYAVPVSLTKP